MTVRRCLPWPNPVLPIRRPRVVTVRFLNPDGVSEDGEVVGLWATSVQHQIDHPAGRMYLDHLSSLRRKMLIARAATLGRQK